MTSIKRNIFKLVIATQLFAFAAEGFDLLGVDLVFGLQLSQTLGNVGAALPAGFDVLQAFFCVPVAGFVFMYRLMSIIVLPHKAMHILMHSYALRIQQWVYVI